MPETLHNLGLGFSVALSPPLLLYAFVGCVIGTLVGVLPGVGPLAGISLLLPATLGMLLGTVGIDQMTGYMRYAYGVVELGDGLGVVPVAVGLFGVAEILATAGQSAPPSVIKPRLRELLPSA